MPIDPSKAQFLQSAIPAAQASQAETGVPASVTLAQAILESDWGRRHIGEANNYFGIKARPQPDGSFNHGSIAIGHLLAPTKEWDGSQMITVNAPFRRYHTMTDSFRDHGLLLKNNARYSQAFRHTNDPNEFAQQIHKAGYATDPGYADKLIGIMRAFDLYQYDQQSSPGAGSVLHSSWPSLRRNASGEQVATLQFLLTEHGAKLVVDGHFGARTQAAVEAFQQQNGLEADGIVGPRTWQVLIIARRIGDSGSAVRAIQSQLSAKGFATDTSGTFDTSTDSMVKRFQAARGLSADGIVGPRTWLVLVQT
jgi:hypothetical protein